jgi:hypothetical protein
MSMIGSSSSGRLRRGWWFAALLAAAVLALLPACKKTSATFRYRLTVEVEVDGEVKSASSIIEILYYGLGGDVGASGARSYSTYSGVAPVIDLGSHGMLAATMEYDDSEWHRRKKQYGLTCKQPVGAVSFPRVFGLQALQLEKLPAGDKHQLPEDVYPAFVWFPDGAPWPDAKQLCPEEFEGVIGGVKFLSISIEPAPGAPISTKLDIQAPWLDQLRIDQKGGLYGHSGMFNLSLTNLEWNGGGIKNGK